jgi:hypothetical protein
VTDFDKYVLLFCYIYIYIYIYIYLVNDVKSFQEKVIL